MDGFQQGMDEDGTDDMSDQRKSKKKKMTPAMLKKLQAKLAEETRQNIIKQKQDYLRDTKIRVQAEWEANHVKAETYENEFIWRLSKLEKAFKILREVDTFWENYNKQLRKEEEWVRYLSSGRLPDPALVPEMNTYIYVWTEIENHNQMSRCIKKTEEVMKLLNGLEVLINHPAPDCSAKSLEDLKESRCKMRYLLQDNIDKATFHLFSRIESEMVPINVTTSKYTVRCPHFLMSLWAELITPIPSTKGKEVRQPLKVVFEETDVVVVVPVSLLDIHKVMRSMWLHYDHWSDRCRTYDCPKLPNYFKQNLLQLFIEQNDVKLDLLNYREKLESTKKRTIGALPPEPSLSQEITAWESQPQRSLSEEVSFKEWEEEEEMSKRVKGFINQGEVNLREWTILGDLLLVEVLHQPPQPKCLRYKHSVTLRQDSSVLKNVDFYYKIPPPPPPEPEDSEQTGEMERRRSRRYNSSRPDVNLEKKKFVQIQLKPCQSVVWFEHPKVAHWNTEDGYWSTEDIHDVEINEDDGTIAFKAGRLGLFGLYVSRYCNLPYEDWTFEPDVDDEIKFSLRTPKLDLYFRIREGEVCLYHTKQFPGKAIKSVLGIYYPPVKLMEVLKERGLDLSPPPDAAAYLEGTEAKHYIIERTIYQVWGLFSKSFRFKRSKFNQLSGRTNIIFQAQEIYIGHQVDYCLIQNSMCSSYVLDITEDSREYSPEPASEKLQAVEIFGLLYNNSTLQARRLTEVTSYLLIATVKEFLSLVRPLSFS